LEFASPSGNTDIMNLLLKATRITSIDSYMLTEVVYSDNPETVKVILFDPKLNFFDSR
jgi:hypothetical protein